MNGGIVRLGLLLGALSGALLLWPGQTKAQQTKTFYNELPEQQTYQGIPYLAGGVGADERERLEGVAKDYNLKLIFALEAGNYVAIVDVVIRDAAGQTVLQATSPGPWLFTRLPAGSYTVTATDQGGVREKPVEVAGAALKEVQLLW